MHLKTYQVIHGDDTTDWSETENIPLHMIPVLSGHGSRMDVVLNAPTTKHLELAIELC